jgi:hypothetical protein
MPRRELTDALSPILVKEFRQGVRGHAFTGAFLLLHVLMVLAMALSLIDPGARQMSPIFWFLLVIPICIVVPLSGMQAISAEAALKTLEPMLLTRLSPRAIVFGKWVSLVAQDLILMISVLPYFLLRYFLGGLSFAEETWLAVAFAVVAVVSSALTVGLSATGFSTFFRWIAGFPLLGLTATAITAFLSPASRAMVPLSGWTLLLAVGLCGLTVLLTIEGGAWHVAPAADRSSARARTAVLAWIPFVAFVLRRPMARELDETMIWTMALLGLVIVGSLCEPQSTIPSVYRPFFGRGFVRRLAGGVLAPGWAAGVVFTLLVVGTAAGALRPAEKTLASLGFILAVSAQLVLPIAVAAWVPMRRLRPLLAYLALQALSLLIGGIAPFAEEIDAPSLRDVAVWLVPMSPVVGFIVERTNPDLTPYTIDSLSVLAACAVIGIALVRAAVALRAAARLVRGHAVEPAGPLSIAPSSSEVPVERVANL